MAAILASTAAHALEDTNATPATNVAAADADALLRSVLILQEQLRDTRREVQAAREQAESVSRQTSELLNERLAMLEAKQADAQRRQLEALQGSNHLMLQAVGIVAGMACLAVLLTGWMQWRAVNRLARISEQLNLLPALAAPAMHQLGNGNSNGHGAGVIPPALVHPTSEELASSVERLQTRLQELELAATSTAAPERKEPPESPPSEAMAILGKGQTLLSLNKTDEALGCFEEAISMEPGCVDAWVKKAAALERLQRPDDAIAAYDRAIAIDQATATTYLLKAGTLNRQKRYTEALQCYEKALQAQKARGLERS